MVILGHNLEMLEDQPRMLKILGLQGNLGALLMEHFVMVVEARCVAAPLSYRSRKHVVDTRQCLRSTPGYTTRGCECRFVDPAAIPRVNRQYTLPWDRRSEICFVSHGPREVYYRPY